MKKLILLSAFWLGFASVLLANETLVEKQISSCERIGYPEWRDDCYESLGKSLQSYSICLKITNKQRRAMCFIAHPPQNTQDCLLNKSPYEIDVCLMSLKQSTKDLSLCKSISDRAIRKNCYACSSNAKEMPMCLEFRAKQLNDKTICNLLDTPKAQMACLSQIAAKTTVAGCEQPQSLLDFKLCRQFAIAQNEEIKNTKKNHEKEKIQKSNQDKQALISQKAEKIKQEKNERLAKLQQAKEEKAAKLQQQKDARQAMTKDKAAKAQQAKEEKAARLKHEKEAHAAIAQKRSEKIQKEAQAHKRTQTKQQAKVNQENSSQEKLIPTQPVEQSLDIKNALTEDQGDIFSQTMTPAPINPVKYSTNPQASATSESVKISDIPRTDDSKLTGAEAKSEKIKKENEAKAQAREQKVRKLNEYKEAKAKEKRDRIQKAKEEKESKAKEKAAKLKEAKEKREAQAKERTDKIKKAKEDRLKSKQTNIQDAQPQSDATQFNGCTKGFGSWTEPPQPRNEEILCDKENIEQFKPLINHCLTTDRHNILIMSYDMNKDGCVTCADLNQWKRQVKELYRAKKRSTDERYLNLKECQDRKF